MIAAESTPMLSTSDSDALVAADAKSHRRFRWLSVIGARCAATFRWLRAASNAVLGFFSLILLLSILATLPLLQFLSLGYLLEASGRVARTGRWSDGVIGFSTARRIGIIAISTLICFLPTRLASSFWYSSYLLNGPEAANTRQLWVVTLLLALFAVTHCAWAIFRGGSIAHFLWPAPTRLWRRIRQGGIYDEASVRLWTAMRGMRLPYYFSLGFRGFAGALCWLALPVTLMFFSSRVENTNVGGALLAIGGLMLSLVASYLPLLQIRLPMTGKFSSQFDLRSVRETYRRAPVAQWFAVLVIFASAVPLYLLKAELVPREAAWLPSLLFVLMLYPARLLLGWAVGRARWRDRPTHWLYRAVPNLAFIPTALLYVLIVYGTQFTSWYGAWSLYEQHAFSVPVPFLGF